MNDPRVPRCTCGAEAVPGAPHARNCDLEISKPTGPLTPGQVQCTSCQENERSRAAGIDGLCRFCRASGEARLGHQFHFQVMIQGAHRNTEGLYVDAPEPEEYDPFTLTVRAWNLQAACRKAAETPLAKWKHDGEEMGARPWRLADLSDDRRDKKHWLPEDDRDVTNGLVFLDGAGKPACVLHGAMHRVSAEPGPVRIYRCSEMRCGLGAQLIEEET